MTRWLAVWVISIIIGIWYHEAMRNWWMGLLVASAILFFWPRYSSAKRYGVSLALFWLCLAVLRAGQVEEKPDPMFAALGKTVVLSGRVQDGPTLVNGGMRSEERLRMILAVEAVDHVLTQETVSCYLPLEGQLEMGTGQKIALVGKLAGGTRYHNPGQTWSVDSRYRCTVADWQSVSMLDATKDWSSRANIWRQKIRALLADSMPGSEASALEGLLFGGASGIPSDWLSVFSTTGLIHILSVSGTHVALLIGVVFCLARNIMPNGAAAAAALIVSLAYGVVCGFSSPVVRSLLMGWIALGALCSGRDGDAWAALCFAAGGLLLYEPALLWDISFQLSFAATMGLLAFNKPLQKIGSVCLPENVAGLLAVTIGAQLGSLPFLAWYFKSLSLASLPANLIVAPMLEIVMMLGLAGALLGGNFLLAGKMAFVLASFVFSLAFSAAKILAQMPGATLPLPPFGLVSGSVYFLLLSLPWWPLAWRSWKKQAGMLLAVLLLAILYAPSAGVLELHIIDVGQGEAILLKTPSGRAVLIDAGQGGTGDVGKRVVVPYLTHQGVYKLEYLLLSHEHDDHAGGAPAVVEGIKVDQLLVPAGPATPPVMQAIRLSDRPPISLRKGQRLQMDGVDIEVLAAGEFETGNRNENEGSAVVRIQYGKRSFLLTGDLEGRSEAALVKAQGERLHSTVLKVGHHGAAKATSEEFLALVQPTCAAISVGAGNSYGHPHPETLRRLQRDGVRVYRTDERGAIIFSTDGDRLSVQTWRDLSDNPWEWKRQNGG
ncbi:DNA internalization-related competence protein ComEC/Rec2 [Azotosporobacter soli]|uniref:DNA internalization-related competence protein ComEC/Rec2 n=1 Tax=Azotosporobacter soli TaxID=3055040 RepID=UPI0031FF470B